MIYGDFRDSEAVARLIAGSEVVYHCAAKVNSAGTLAEFVETNVTGTESILRACLAARVRRVVYLSSIAVYGLVKPGQSIDENTPYDEQSRSRDFYAQSKILADRFATEFSRTSGLPLTIVRPGIVYGPGSPLPVALMGFRAGRLNVVFGDRSNRFPLNYLENLVDALELLSNPGHAGSQQYNIVDNEALTLDSYHRARTEVGGTRPLFLPGWPVLAAASVLDVLRHALPVGSGPFSNHQVMRALQNRVYVTRRVREELGWTPRVSLKDALRESLNRAPIRPV